MNGQVIERIGVDFLLEHPGNPNRMSKSNFRKLVGHIKESGDYEPVIVRQHSQKEGFYEILNGHHRTKALRELGYTEIDCVVWDVDDARSLMLLATLNRLSGKDDARKRAELINELSEQFNIKELTNALPETKEAIEKLKTISASEPVLQLGGFEIPETLVYIVTAEQKEFVNKIVNEAIEPDKGANDAERRAWALVEILRFAKV
ncbi:MAG: ParB/RepB/Spo0J family partition protein [Phycisphaerae bacterium]|nr:ParB/RepB/Spo0J family partition protein [Phycisphaerae bacterium]